MIKSADRAAIAAENARAAVIAAAKEQNDPVNHPAHYTDGGIETIDFIEAKQLPYHLGNVVKYVSRAGKKLDALEDLKKAQWYLNRYIELMEENGNA